MNRSTSRGSTSFLGWWVAQQHLIVFVCFFSMAHASSIANRLIAAQSHFQHHEGWRWCRKCNGMYHADVDFGNKTCAAGLEHDCAGRYATLFLRPLREAGVSATSAPCCSMRALATWEESVLWELHMMVEARDTTSCQRRRHNARIRPAGFTVQLVTSSRSLVTAKLCAALPPPAMIITKLPMLTS
jgi:hypothetical protein